MKLYETIDGTLIGFYQERGGQVQATQFRDVYESQLVDKTREEEITIPGYFEIVVTTVPGYWAEKEVYVQGHYERQMVWQPEYSVPRYREVPGHIETESEYVQGHYEIQNIWVPEYYVTRYYWREAHPARGLEAGWIPYQELIPAGFKEQRVWVEGDFQDVEVWIPTYTEEYQEIIPAGEKETRVWIDGEFVIRKTWVPEKQISDRVWIPPEKDFITVPYQEFEEVWVGREAVYEYVDESLVRQWEVVELIPDVVDVPQYKDVIVIRNCLNGDLLRTTAKYVGLGERIADNEFVVP